VDLIPIDFPGYTIATVEEMVAEKMHKFMQSLGGDVYRQLAAIAEERGVSLQELIRAVVIPEWLRLLTRSRSRIVASRAVSE